ncbi:MAG: virulence protein SciE type [Rhodobacterales bacterium 17-64-5]|nr:MAG: virulence protein SciE type [Rhodobacterales bacterium 17-64-5]
MTPEEQLKAGDPAGALAALQVLVKARPGDAKLRIFLFQLLCILGQWDRAIRQLKVCGELDPGALQMCQAYREAIICEVYREKVFAGDKAALVFGEPQEWLAWLMEAQKMLAKGEVAAAADLRARAFEAAPGSAGDMDGTRFEWIADADMRIGPVLEAIVNGRYFWLPFAQIRQITFDPPTDLRDAVWTAANIKLANEGSVVALLPSRYPFSGQKGDAAEKLSRATNWTDAGSETFVGLGQKLLSTDQGDVALLDARLIKFDASE